MNSFFILFAVLATGWAKPAALIAPFAFGITSSQYHSQDVLGQYSYGYTNALSSKTETKTADGITRGGYSYIDAEGKLQTVEYTSDSINGFRVTATNLPILKEKSNEMPETKARENQEGKSGSDIVEVETPASVIPAAIPYFFQQPLLPFTYAYGFPKTQFTTYTYGKPAITTYSAPIVAPIAAQSIVAPTETPEVAKARAEHLEEVEKVKARNA